MDTANLQIVEVNTEDRKQVSQFINLPFRLYTGLPQWVPPLEHEAKQMLDRRRHPFYKIGQAVFFIALRNRQVVGRVAILNNHNYNQFNRTRQAFFYLFECENDIEAASALFHAAVTWARHQGLDEIIGPKGFSPFDGLGMLVKGFEYRPAFGLPYNLPYYPSLVEAAGFTAAGELVSGYLDERIQFPEKIHQMAELIQKRRGLHVVRLNNRRELRAIIPRIKELYNSSLGGTEGNVPLTDAEVNQLADQLLWFADPKLIKIVMKGETPVGFLFAYPDVSAAVQRTRGRVWPFGWIVLLLELKRTKWININGAGMLEGYRGLGGTALLFSEMFKSVTESKYRFADIVQIGTNNERTC